MHLLSGFISTRATLPIPTWTCSKSTFPILGKQSNEKHIKVPWVWPKSMPRKLEMPELHAPSWQHLSHRLPWRHFSIALNAASTILMIKWKSCFAGACAEIAQWQREEKIFHGINWLTKLILNTSCPQHMDMISEWPRLVSRPWLSLQSQSSIGGKSPPLAGQKHSRRSTVEGSPLTVQRCHSDGQAQRMKAPGVQRLYEGEETGGSTLPGHHYLQQWNEGSWHPCVEIRRNFFFFN